MEQPDLVAETRAQRRALVATLEGVTAADWDAPSLCTGWRVRELVAHLTMPFRYTGKDVLVAVLQARGSFDLAAERLARHDALELRAAELLDCLRANVDHPWRPPGGGQLGALSHDVVHGLDITVPLGLPPASPPDRTAVVLGALSPRRLRAAGVDLRCRRLEATDAAVARGAGAAVRGTAAELLLLCTGRVPTAAVRPA